MRLEEHFAAVCDGNPFRRSNIAGDKGKPRRLPLRTRGSRTFKNAGDRTSLEHCDRKVPGAAMKVLKTPSEEPRVEFLGGGKIRRHKVDPDDLARVMLRAWRLYDRREHKRCRRKRHRTGHAQERTE